MIQITSHEVFTKVVSDAVQAAITNCSSEAGAKRWCNAIDRAVLEIETNPYLHWEGGKLLICSPSNNIYSANGVCQCTAFNLGFACWHRAAARLVRLYFEALNTPPAAKAAAVNQKNEVTLLPTVNFKKAERVGGIRIN